MAHEEAMYQVARLQAEAGDFRLTVEKAEPFRPLMVKIKLLWDCNLACGMCDYWRQGGSSPLSFSLVTRVLDELAALGCLKVHFSGGEPTIRPDLPDIIAYARRLKLRATLTTNGTLLTRDLARRLVKAGLNSACVSIDSPVRSVHDRLRGAPGAFKQTIAGVRELRRAAKQRDMSLPIRINTVVSRENYDRLDGLPELVHSLGAKSLLLLPVDDPSGELLLNKRRLWDYTRRIAPALAAQAMALGVMHSPLEAFPFGTTREELAASRNGQYARGLYQRQPCYAPWTHALIAADGRVAPCCSAPRVTLGNVQQQSCADIWRGNEYRRLREAMRDGARLPHCAGCDVFLAENQVLHRICHSENGHTACWRYS
jgi:radical SAM protein with 4Fe4S-binding SPASM domain